MYKRQGVDVTVALDHELRSACPEHAALLGPNAREQGYHVVEERHTHAVPALEVLEPHAEERLVEARETLGLQRVLVARLVEPRQAGDELDEVELVLPVEAVELLRVMGCLLYTSTFATQGWPQHPEQLEGHHPTTALVTARDIIALWVARMVMSSLYFLDEVPFHDVVIYPCLLYTSRCV